MSSGEEPTGALHTIGASLLERLEALNLVRDRALNEGRQVIRQSANSVRALHRNEINEAERLLDSARGLLTDLVDDLVPFPSVRWAGYVQDAMKEFAEASITLAIVAGRTLPSPNELGVDDAPYLNALAEGASELRRLVLDSLRSSDYRRAEMLLESMDDIYSFLVTVDYPDGLTGGLRRSTDALRAVLERTRGDLTITGAQNRLLQAINEAGPNVEVRPIT
jgi:translin